MRIRRPSATIVKNISNSAFKTRAFKKAFEGGVMETRVIQLRTHQKNIDRYQGLLKTKLNDTERQYLEKRLSEETIAMLQLAPSHQAGGQ
jgi:hypothetical protein